MHSKPLFFENIMEIGIYLLNQVIVMTVELDFTETDFLSRTAPSGGTVAMRLTD